MKVSFCRFFFWQKVSSNDRLNRLMKGVAPTHYNDELHLDDVITIMIPAIQHFFPLVIYYPHSCKSVERRVQVPPTGGLVRIVV